MNPIRFSKILIVDDSEAFRVKVKSILSDAEIGYYYYQAKDGREAVSQYITHKPHVVIMDLMMPNIGGITAIQAIMKHDPNARIVVASTRDNKELVDDAIKRGGARDYVFKPFHSGAIVMAVSRQLLMNRDYRRHSVPSGNLKKPLVYNGVKHGQINNVNKDGEFEMNVNHDPETDKILENIQDIKDMGKYYEIIL